MAGKLQKGLDLLKSGKNYIKKKATDYSDKRNLRKQNADLKSAEKMREKLNKLEQKQINERRQYDIDRDNQRNEFADLIVKSNPKAAKRSGWEKGIREKYGAKTPKKMKHGGMVVVDRNYLKGK
jgi:hypothetical protein